MLPVLFEQILREILCEKVSILFGSGALDDLEVALVVLIPKPVPLDLEVLGTIGDPVVGCQVVSTLVVL